MDDGSLSAQQVLSLISLQRLPFAIFLMVLFLGGLALLTRLLENLGERFTERRLLLKKVAAILRFFVYLVLAILIPLTVLEGEARKALVPLVASLGFGLGFALKDQVASLMGGVLLLFDQPFQVGDRVSFNGYYGEISEIGLRSVRLITLDDSLVTIPNSLFFTNAVSSGNAGALDMMVVVPIYIAPGENFDLARQVLEEVAATSVYVYVDKPVVTVMSDQFMGERFVTVISVKAYVFDARDEKRFVSDVTERAKRAFRRLKIATPDLAYRDLEVNDRETP